MEYSSHPISRVISFIHALFVSTISIYILMTRIWVFLSNPLYEFDSLWSLMFIVTSIYFSCDITLMLLMPSKGDTSWIIHHIVGGIGMVSTWYSGRMWFLGLLFELTEISTIFLNIIWILLKFKQNHTLIFKIAGIFLLLTFFIIRWIGGLIMWYYIYDNINTIYQSNILV